MARVRFLSTSAAAIAMGAVLVGRPGVASAEITRTFENYSTGTVITSQYAGVTFSAQPGSCGGGNPKPVIVTPVAGTSSGTRALSVQTGCPDFSPDFLRMVFDLDQERVTFTLGEYPGTYQVRAYTSAGTLISTQIVVIGSLDGVHRLVTVQATAVNKIRRVEVDEVVDQFEAIDDLTYVADNTPPEASITSPAFQACVCSGSVSIKGTACDSDGEYDHDVLEYMQLTGAGAPGPWTLVDDASTPQCADGPLYTWNTSSLAEGWYLLRVTVVNEEGVSSAAVTTVYLDKSFSMTWATPPNGASLCGLVAFTGTIYEKCFQSYTVEYKPNVGGVWKPVDPATPSYGTVVLDCTFATWNTVGLGIADGTYSLRVTGTDSCGNTQTMTRSVTIDNTPPTPGCDGTADLNSDGTVDAADLALLLGAWGPI